MKLKSYHTLLFFLCGIGCFVDIMSAQSLTTATRSHDPQLKTYMLTFPPSSSSSFCEKLKTDLQALQAKGITMYEEAGIAVCTSSDPDFKSKCATIQDLNSVIQDRPIQRKAQSTKTSDATISTQDDAILFDQESKNTRRSHDKSDPLVGLQWGLDAIHAREVHKAGYKGKGVRIAVLDSGFDLDHPDIKKNVDYQASASFVPGEPLQFIPPTDGSEPFSPATMEASVIAAAENGVGIVGVAPKATLILMKVISDVTLEGEWSWAISAIMKAVHEGADIINMNTGAVYDIIVDSAELAEDLALLTQAFTYANNKGVVIVTTSFFGSLNLDTDPFVALPAAVPYAIAVSATAPIGWLEDPLRRSLDNIASYSNIGKSVVDFAAPGGDFVSPNETEVTYGGLTLPLWEFDGIIGANYDNTWTFGQGFATPHVSGLAALIIGKYDGKITPCEVKKILRESADDLGKLGRDASYGYGRVNAYNALIGYKY